MPAGQLRPPPLTKDIFPDAVCGVVPPEVVPCAMDAAPAEPAAATRTETAHRAVEATRQAIDLFPPPGHPGLKLQFSVGGEPLLVRVEWQGSEVRTVFHTDSPELQALLAQEWQGVAAPEPERGIRLAPPQFLTLGDSHAGGRSQERADDRRRRPGPDGFDAESVKAIRHAPLVAASPRAPAHRTSLHLHTQA